MSRGPNILFLMTDQMQGGVLDPNHPCMTPNLDRLARRGTRFTRAYTPNAVCSPARASLMTGLLPHNHGVLEVTHVVDDDQCCLREEYPHWAQRLQEAGYRNGYFGKWHIERTNELERFGWDVNCESSQPAVTEYVASVDGAYAGVTDEGLTRVIDDSPDGYRSSRLYGVTDVPAERHHVGMLTDIAENFLKDAVKQDQPWCCFVSCGEPHDPYVCAREDYELYDVDSLELPANAFDEMADKPGVYRKSARVFANLSERERKEAMACYYASITGIDRQYGRLIDVVEKAGQLDNTIIVFTTDHGDFLGAHGLYCKNIGSFEEAYNIPMIVTGPGLAEGEVSDARVGGHELCPTLLELAGAEAIDVPDSNSFADVLADPTKAVQHTTGFAEYYGGRWRLTQFLYWEDEWKFVFNGFDFDELYNLADDPYEMTNLAGNPAHADMVKRMTTGVWRELKKTGEQNAFRTHYPPLRLGAVGPNVLDDAAE